MRGNSKWYLPDDRYFDPDPSQTKVAMKLYNRWRTC
jgi:hypothetical protein